MLYIAQGGAERVVVDCTGDIALGGCLASKSEDGRAVLIVLQHLPGEPGRSLASAEYDFSKPHVLIQTRDPRSFDSFIEILTALRDDLRTLPKTPADGEPDEQS